jgi:hypothetical protein
MDGSATGPYDASSVYEQSGSTNGTGTCSPFNNYDAFTGLHVLQAYENALNAFLFTANSAIGAQGLGIGLRM